MDSVTLDPVRQLRKIATDAGLDQTDFDRAMSRAGEALQALLPRLGSGNPETSSRMTSGFAKNLVDNPMLVAWAMKVAASTSEVVWRKFVDNFLVSLVSERLEVVAALKQELGYVPPLTLVLNPTMRCGLRCRGCYAFEFDRGSDMDRALLDKVLTEARLLGIHFITITGGEAFLYPNIEDLFASYPDITFMVYTNAQHIDQKRAERLAGLGNVWPAISVEGFRSETDARRGEGVYDKLVGAMGHLKAAGVLFGISAVPTRENTDLLSSDEFLEHYMALGANFGWTFTYMPVGRKSDVSLMGTPAQRQQMHDAALRWRKTKPMFMVDFWNDGPLCGGCMSASRYAFITSDGWVQPCTFVHFATHNVREHSLREIFGTPLFRAIRERQPYSSNLLRPCKIIDHPQVLRDLVAQTGAKPTCEGADAVIADPAIVAHLDEYSKAYAVLADATWASPAYEGGRSVQVPFFGRVDLHQVYAERMQNAKRVEGSCATDKGKRKKSQGEEDFCLEDTGPPLHF